MAVAGGQEVARRADVDKAKSSGILAGAFGHGVDIETVEFPGWTKRRGNLIKRALGRPIEQLREPGCVDGSPAAPCSHLRSYADVGQVRDKEVGRAVRE